VILLGVGQVKIGNFAGYGLQQNLASFEIYLRGLNQTEMVAAMKRSLTLPSNPKCAFD